MIFLVGPAIQVRRQDKKHEAKFVDLNVYVEQVKDYFDIKEAKTLIEQKPKYVFVATDEPEVIWDLNKKFPLFDWMGDITKARNSMLENRYTKEGQDAIIKDVFKLAFSDFLVCTFSSNVCRLAYELRMAYRPFVSNLYEVITLDMDYFFMYGSDMRYKVIKDSIHSDESELKLIQGDQIHVDTCYMGCKTPHNTGTNLRTSIFGHFLRSKVTRMYNLTDKYFPHLTHFTDQDLS